MHKCMCRCEVHVSMSICSQAFHFVMEMWKWIWNAHKCFDKWPCYVRSMRMWIFHDNASLSCQCAKTNELVLAQSHVLWRFHYRMYKCKSCEMCKLVKKTCKYVISMHKPKYAMWVREFVCEFYKPIMLKWNHAKQMCKLVTSFHPSASTCETSDRDLCTFFEHFWLFAFVT